MTMRMNETRRRKKKKVGEKLQLIYSFGIGMMYDSCRVYRNAAPVVERISIGRLQYVSSCRRSAGFAIHTSRALRCIVGKHEEIFKTSRHQNWHFGRCNCVTRVWVGITRRTLQFVCRRSSINSIRLMIDFFLLWHNPYEVVSRTRGSSLTIRRPSSVPKTSLLRLPLVSFLTSHVPDDGPPAERFAAVVRDKTVATASAAEVGPVTT